MRGPSPVKIVHASDLHLDSPLVGLERYEGAPVEAIRGATRRAFENLVTLCIDEGAALLLVAGDVYDGDWKDYATGLFFAATLGRLREAGTRVVVVRGNHDAASQITRNLRLPSHVKELSKDRAETVRFEDIGVAVHGQSFRDRSVREDLAGRYPEPDKSLLNVGLLHTSLTGREGHDDYAPCTPATLKNRGYDYWALGHVHRREVVSTDPYIVYPGNLQGRNARETGPKGATVVEVHEGRVVGIDHRALDVVRWVTCEVTASDVHGADDVVDLCRARMAREVESADGRTIAARVVVRGTSRAHVEIAGDPDKWQREIQAAATDIADELWVERVDFALGAPVDGVALAARDDAIGQVAKALLALREDEGERSAFLSQFADLRAKLPPEAREGLEAVNLDDPLFWDGALADVEKLLLPALAAMGSDE
jgi:DNA repair exonuclease SbcCD nuclease subunit